ncbi:MAG: hypothetical protein WKF37_19910 [Bryobacteraceae bacterium]
MAPPPRRFVEGFGDSATVPSLFEAAQLGKRVPTTSGDVRDFPAVLNQFARQQPEIVFHMAAQALVRRSTRIRSEPTPRT